MNPEPTRKTDSYRRETNRAGQSDEVIEDWDRLGENKRQRGEPECARQPCTPVDERVGLEMPRVAEDAHKDVLGRDVEVEGCAHDEADQPDSVRHHLYCLSGALGYPRQCLPEDTVDLQNSLQETD